MKKIFLVTEFSNGCQASSVEPATISYNYNASPPANTNYPPGTARSQTGGSANWTYTSRNSFIVMY